MASGVVFGVLGAGAARGQVMEIVSAYRVVSGSVGAADGNLLSDSANTRMAGYWAYDASGLANQESVIDADGFWFLGMAQTAPGAHSAHGLSLAEFTFRIGETVRWRATLESSAPLGTHRLWRVSDETQLFAGVNWSGPEVSASGVIGPGEYRLRTEMFLVNAEAAFTQRFAFGIEPVPGPGSWLLAAVGVGLMGVWRRRIR